MPALEALQDRFAAANTQTLAISVDSLHCHANWTASVGGISFPVLADFHPKGAVASSYGLFLEKAGITDRATVIMDADGVVRYVASVGPGGERDIAALAAACEKIDGEYAGKLGTLAAGPGLEPGSTLYIKSRCGFSLRALLARTNLHLEDKLAVVNVSEDANAMATLEKLTGKQQAPCLVVGGKPILETDEILKRLVTATTGFWGS